MLPPGTVRPRGAGVLGDAALEDVVLEDVVLEDAAVVGLGREGRQPIQLGRRSLNP